MSKELAYQFIDKRGPFCGKHKGFSMTAEGEWRTSADGLRRIWVCGCCLRQEAKGEKNGA